MAQNGNRRSIFSGTRRSRTTSTIASFPKLGARGSARFASEAMLDGRRGATTGRWWWIWRTSHRDPTGSWHTLVARHATGDSRHRRHPDHADDRSARHGGVGSPPRAGIGDPQPPRPAPRRRGGGAGQAGLGADGGAVAP